MRERSFPSSLLLLLLLLLTAACSEPAEPGAGGPRQTLEEFYRYVNEGDYATAMTLYSADALELWEDPGVGSSFADWAKGETRGGQVDHVRVVGEKLADETADLEYEVVYSSGATTEHTVRLTKEEGRWRMGLIG